MLTSIPNLYRLIGTRITFMFLSAMPLGLALGAMDIALAHVFLLLLSYFKLLPETTASAWITTAIHPIPLFALCVCGATFLRYMLQLLPNLAHAAFEQRMRTGMLNACLLNTVEASPLTLTDITHISSILVVKTGSFVQASVAISSALVSMTLIGASLMYMSWSLTAVMIAGFIVGSLPIIGLRRIFGHMVESTYRLQRDFTTRFLKAVRGAQFLRISGLEHDESDRLIAIANSAKCSHDKHQNINAISANLPFMIAMGLVVLVLIVNQHYELVAVTNLVPFVYLLNRVSGSFSQLANTTGNFREALPYVRNLMSYTNALTITEPLNGTKDGPRNKLQRLESIDVNDVEFGRVAALTEPVTFSARCGEMILIVGPSGIGKTTLLFTLVGLIPPKNGLVLWNGHPIDHLNGTSLRRHLGYAGPEPYLLDDSIRANLLFGLHPDSISEEAIHKSLESAQSQFIYEVAEGLEHQLRDSGDGISAGQKQRLALARCLLQQPDVLLLDEATANIDEATESIIINNIRQLLPDTIILAVSHRPSFRTYATRIVELFPQT